jgi:hypothetical protein
VEACAVPVAAVGAAVAVTEVVPLVVPAFVVEVVSVVVAAPVVVVPAALVALSVATAAAVTMSPDVPSYDAAAMAPNPPTAARLARLVPIVRARSRATARSRSAGLRRAA